MIRGVLPSRNQWAFRKQHNARTVEPRRKPQQPHFPHPRRICLTDSLIPADTSDRERRKARGLGYPTATRLAPADLLGRRGNGATLLMLPPRGPREVARGGEPRGGECLLQTNVRIAASATSLRTRFGCRRREWHPAYISSAGSGSYTWLTARLIASSHPGGSGS